MYKSALLRCTASQTPPEDRQDIPQLRVTASSTEDDMVSIKAVVMVLTFFTVCLLTSNSSAAHGCCHRYMKIKLAFDQIKGYSVQSSSEFCPIDAIIFLSKKGNLFCADPSKSWVMDYVNRLRAKAQSVHQKSLAHK